MHWSQSSLSLAQFWSQLKVLVFEGSGLAHHLVSVNTVLTPTSGRKGTFNFQNGMIKCVI